LTSASQEDWAETVATQPRARTIFIMVAVAVVVVVVVGGLVSLGRCLDKHDSLDSLMAQRERGEERRWNVRECRMSEDCPCFDCSVRGRTTAPGSVLSHVQNSSVFSSVGRPRRKLRSAAAT
jgi:hypothetical protein